MTPTARLAVGLSISWLTFGASCTAITSAQAT
jgi:hypothetical protein